jgi:hypothetical protein
LDAKQSIYVVADESNFLDDITSNAKDKYYFFVQHGNDKFIERLEKCVKIEGRSDSLSEEKKVFFSIEPRTVDRALKTLSSSPLSIDSSNCTEPEAGPWEEWGECCRGNKCGVYCDEPDASRGRRRELNFDKFIDQLLREEEEEEEEEEKLNETPKQQLCYPSLTANWQVDKQCGAKKCGERRVPYTCTTALQYAKKIASSSSSSSVLFGAGKSESGWDSSFSWGVKERNNIAIGIDGQEDGSGSTGSVKIQLYGEGAFALGKKITDGKVFLETFSRFNRLNVFVARERYPQPLPRLTLQIEFYFWRDGGVFSNNDASVIFSSNARFETATSDDGWQSGCYEKAFASFKNEFTRGDGGESLSDFLRNKKQLFESADTVTIKVAVRNASRKSPIVFYVGSVAFVA